MPQTAEHNLTWENAFIGQSFPPFYWKLTADEIKWYTGEVLEDQNPAYLDEEFATKTKLGGIVAPAGMLNYYAFWWRVLQNANRLPESTGMVYTKGSTEFFNPARPGDVLTINLSVIDRYQRRDKNYLTWLTEVRNQNGEQIVRSEATWWFWSDEAWPKHPGLW